MIPSFTNSVNDGSAEYTSQLSLLKNFLYNGGSAVVLMVPKFALSRSLYGG